MLPLLSCVGLIVAISGATASVRFPLNAVSIIHTETLTLLQNDILLE